MLDLQAHLHRPPAPASAPEPTKAPATFTVRKMAHAEEWTRNPDATRSTKTTDLAKGARSESESRILNALRKAPASSIADLARTTRLPELAAQLAWQAMMHRGGLVREDAGLLGKIRLVAVD